MSVNRQGVSLIDLMIVVLIIGILATIAIPNFISLQQREKLKREAMEQLTYVSAEAQDYYRIHGMWPPHDWEITAMMTVGSLRTYNFHYIQDTGRNGKEFIARAIGLNSGGSINRRVVTVHVVWGDAPKFTFQGL